MISKYYSESQIGFNFKLISFMKKNGYYILLAMMSLILILTLIFALSMGRYSIDFSTIIKVLLSKVIDINVDWSITEQQVIESVRMPRILVAGLCGASLALSGSALQGLFRNPLVGPQVIGVSSGAAFGGVIAILLMLPDFYIAIFAFVFGVVALLIAMMIKHNVENDQNLYQTLQQLRFQDGTFEATGLEGVEALMTQDYVPSGHVSQYPSAFKNGFGSEHDKQSFEFGPSQVAHDESQGLQVLSSK